MCRPKCEPPVPEAWCMQAGGMARERHHLGLVDGDPIAHAVAEASRHELGVRSKPRRRLRRGPTAFVLQGLRQVPVIESDQRPDAVLEERVDEAVVEVEAGGISLALARGDDTR